MTTAGARAALHAYATPLRRFQSRSLRHVSTALACLALGALLLRNPAFEPCVMLSILFWHLAAARRLDETLGLVNPGTEWASASKEILDCGISAAVIVLNIVLYAAETDGF